MSEVQHRANNILCIAPYSCYNITLNGVDWYGYNAIELSSLINDELENSYCIFAAPGEKAEVTLVFSIQKSTIKEKDWPTVSQKEMWINLTYGPQYIDVKLDLAQLNISQNK